MAGNGTLSFSGDGGPATEAGLATAGVAISSDGSLYITDGYNLRVRRVGTDGIITTVAGDGSAGFSGDGGPATEATFHAPYSLAIGPDGSVYFIGGPHSHANPVGQRVRRVADGIIITVAGNGTRGIGGDGGPAADASFRVLATGGRVAPAPWRTTLAVGSVFPWAWRPPDVATGSTLWPRTASASAD